MTIPMQRILNKLIKSYLNERPPALDLSDGTGDSMAAIKRNCADLFEKLTDKTARKWVMALLYIANGHLDAAAKQLPKKEDPQTSYIHGLIQRRQGDYAQASYYFRVANEHPGLQAIAEALVAHEDLHPVLRNFPGVLKNQQFNPAALTGIIQQVCMGGHVSLEPLIRKAQAVEMEALLRGIVTS